MGNSQWWRASQGCQILQIAVWPEPDEFNLVWIHRQSATSSIYPINFGGSNIDSCWSRQSTMYGPDSCQSIQNVCECVWQAQIKRSAINGKVPVQYPQKNLGFNGIKRHTEVLNYNSIDVARVYCLHDLIMHGNNSSFCWLLRPESWLTILKDMLRFDMMFKMNCCSSLNNL